MHSHTHICMYTRVSKTKSATCNLQRSLTHSALPPTTAVKVPAQLRCRESAAIATPVSAWVTRASWSSFLMESTHSMFYRYILSWVSCQTVLHAKKLACICHTGKEFTITCYCAHTHAQNLKRDQYPQLILMPGLLVPVSV